MDSEDIELGDDQKKLDAKYGERTRSRRARIY